MKILTQRHQTHLPSQPNPPPKSNPSPSVHPPAPSSIPPNLPARSDLLDLSAGSGPSSVAQSSAVRTIVEQMAKSNPRLQAVADLDSANREANKGLNSVTNSSASSVSQVDLNNNESLSDLLRSGKRSLSPSFSLAVAIQPISQLGYGE